ncbi:MAG TPA: penicillin-binding transpeptidase domain-containing protein, partial [Longimicrobiales bacterium]|nr:penicillin-binding transpeptidase domain-containing protein [Longimicrobiales bacterium]
ERRYEARLQGADGVRYVEVDARGRIVGGFASPASVEPRNGEDLHLNVDLELQRWIHRIFPDSMAGAVVALDPADGGVLALYSAPTYDPQAFVGGLAPELWDSLSSDPGRPLFDRATRGLYAPASTWKPAVAAIALELGVVTPEEYMPLPCTGSFLWGGRVWHCWKREGHGYNTLAEAIGNSCDVYFYQLGLRVGVDRLLARATELGFNDVTGIDLPAESRGVFPEDRSFWSRRFGYEAQEGEVLSLAIGQGPNSQTPLRMAQFYEALARGGSAPPPALAEGVTLGPGWSLDLSPENVRALREGLRKVTAPGGTAHLGATLELWEVLGKTGTGQNPASLAGEGQNDAWFAGMAGPFGEDPEIVVVALVEGGGSGSAVAAPLVSKTADFYLRRKRGIPVDTIQTLGEWVRTRGWPRWYRERYGGGAGGA